MKTLFTILQLFVAAVASLVMSCVYIFIFTPAYMIVMATIGLSFNDICDKWVHISSSLLETIYEEA
jgi:hypothetical protein